MMWNNSIAIKNRNNIKAIMILIILKNCKIVKIYFRFIIK